MSDGAIDEVTDSTFEREVIASDVPVLVDYWSTKCKPCKAIAELLDELAGQYQGRLKIKKLNIDNDRSMAAKFGVRGVPTLMMFRDGTLRATRIGGLSKRQLVDFIDANLT